MSNRRNHVLEWQCADYDFADPLDWAALLDAAAP